MNDTAEAIKKRIFNRGFWNQYRNTEQQVALLNNTYNTIVLLEKEKQVALCKDIYEYLLKNPLKDSDSCTLLLQCLGLMLLSNLIRREEYLNDALRSEVDTIIENTIPPITVEHMVSICSLLPEHNQIEPVLCVYLGKLDNASTERLKKQVKDNYIADARDRLYRYMLSNPLETLCIPLNDGFLFEDAQKRENFKKCIEVYKKIFSEKCLSYANATEQDKISYDKCCQYWVKTLSERELEYVLAHYYRQDVYNRIETEIKDFSSIVAEASLRMDKKVNDFPGEEKKERLILDNLSEDYLKELDDFFNENSPYNFEEALSELHHGCDEKMQKIIEYRAGKIRGIFLGDKIYLPENKIYHEHEDILGSGIHTVLGDKMYLPESKIDNEREYILGSGIHTIDLYKAWSQYMGCMVMKDVELAKSYDGVRRPELLLAIQKQIGTIEKIKSNSTNKSFNRLNRKSVSLAYLAMLGGMVPQSVSAAPTNGTILSLYSGNISQITQQAMIHPAIVPVQGERQPLEENTSSIITTTSTVPVAEHKRVFELYKEPYATIRIDCNYDEIRVTRDFLQDQMKVRYTKNGIEEIVVIKDCPSFANSNQFIEFNDRKWDLSKFANQQLFKIPKRVILTQPEVTLEDFHNSEFWEEHIQYLYSNGYSEHLIVFSLKDFLQKGYIDFYNEVVPEWTNGFKCNPRKTATTQSATTTQSENTTTTQSATTTQSENTTNTQTGFIEIVRQRVIEPLISIMAGSRRIAQVGISIRDRARSNSIAQVGQLLSRDRARSRRNAPQVSYATYIPENACVVYEDIIPEEYLQRKYSPYCEKFLAIATASDFRMWNLSGDTILDMDDVKFESEEIFKHVKRFNGQVDHKIFKIIHDWMKESIYNRVELLTALKEANLSKIHVRVVDDYYKMPDAPVRYLKRYWKLLLNKFKGVVPSLVGNAADQMKNAIQTALNNIEHKVLNNIEPLTDKQDFLSFEAVLMFDKYHPSKCSRSLMHDLQGNIWATPLTRELALELTETVFIDYNPEINQRRARKDLSQIGELDKILFALKFISHIKLHGVTENVEFEDSLKRNDRQGFSSFEMLRIFYDNHPNKCSDELRLELSPFLQQDDLTDDNAHDITQKVLRMYVSGIEDEDGGYGNADLILSNMTREDKKLFASKFIAYIVSHQGEEPIFDQRLKTAYSLYVEIQNDTSGGEELLSLAECFKLENVSINDQHLIHDRYIKALTAYISTAPGFITDPEVQVDTGESRDSLEQSNAPAPSSTEAPDSNFITNVELEQLEQQGGIIPS